MKTVWKLVLHQFRGWRTNPHVGAAVLLGFGLSLYNISRYFSFANDMQSSVQMFESYVILGSRIPAFLGTLLGCLLLLADAPFFTGLSTYEILRTGRLKWCMSRFLYLVLASILYSVMLLLFTVGISVLTAGGYPDNQWSDAMDTLAVRQPEFVIIKYAFSFPFPEFISACSPCEAMLLTLLFNTFYMVCSGGCVMIVNLYINRNIGWMAALIFHIGGYIVYANGGTLIPLRYSLLCCAAPAYQFCEELQMPTSFCLGVFLLLFLILFLASGWMHRRIEFWGRGSAE